MLKLAASTFFFKKEGIMSASYVTNILAKRSSSFEFAATSF